jgi:hypothetical protein
MRDSWIEKSTNLRLPLGSFTSSSSTSIIAKILNESRIVRYYSAEFVQKGRKFWFLKHGMEIFGYNIILKIILRNIFRKIIFEIFPGFVF